MLTCRNQSQTHPFDGFSEKKQTTEHHGREEFSTTQVTATRKSFPVRRLLHGMSTLYWGLTGITAPIDQ